MQVGIWGWILFNTFILVMLALDLGVFHRNAHEVRVREAAIWTGVWIALALIFSGWVYTRAGPDVALQFLTGYVIEKSLSVDNVFVMVLIFSYFRVPPRYQHRVLFWGVLGALLMRGTFIGLGTYVLHQWHAVIYIFGALLLITGVRMAFKHEETPDLSRTPLLRLARRLIPVTHHYHGHHFLARQNGQLVATPLLLVLLLVEGSDLIFAVDSIPAIFAITEDAFVVYTSNVFAILGLRSMYFMLGDVVHRFAYLKYGLAVVLVFIGSKMLTADLIHISTPISLGVVATAIGTSILFSLKRAAQTSALDEALADTAPTPERERRVASL
ncbi:MAG TPA: TerC family protein [Longimicrobiales bacterium]|nr:TerC family protein [Longimicrobiales bacterium]